MSALRLLADDLTGALDSAAPFVGSGPGPHVLFTQEDADLQGDVALDTGTREMPPALARARVRDAAVSLFDSGMPTFKKVDSLIRGNTLIEIAACVETDIFRSTVVAPAAPTLGRITVGGVQYRRVANELEPCGGPLDGALVRLGVPATLARSPVEMPSSGTVVCDAKSEDDLAEIVREGSRMEPPVLWCGSRGLAGTLGGGAPRIRLNPGPRLVVCGSNHPVARAQCDRLVEALGPARHAPVPHFEALGDGLCVLVRTSPSTSLDEGAAAREIAASLETFPWALPRPETLIVVGGETLRATCEALGTRSLQLEGELEPGFPVSILKGGAWHGVRVASKSGAFGHAQSLASIVGPAGPRSHKPLPTP